MLCKLHGTVKGGAVFGIARELSLPILYVETGQTLEDWAESSAEEFVEGPFGQIP